MTVNPAAVAKFLLELAVSVSIACSGWVVSTKLGEIGAAIKEKGSTTAPPVEVKPSSPPVASPATSDNKGSVSEGVKKLEDDNKAYKEAFRQAVKAFEKLSKDLEGK